MLTFTNDTAKHVCYSRSRQWSSVDRPHVLFAVGADQDVAAHLMVTMLSWGQFTKAPSMPS